MIKNPTSDRKEPNLFLEQAEESPDMDLRGHPNEESWDSEQLPILEGQTVEVSDGEEADTDIENDSLGKANNPVVIYLQGKVLAEISRATPTRVTEPMNAVVDLLIELLSPARRLQV